MIDMSAIKVLSVEQKLQVMEAIWQDLSGEEEAVQSPSWHQEALRETEQRCKAGQEAVFDWADAKRELRKRFE
jgi:hypothetical protein